MKKITKIVKRIFIVIVSVLILGIIVHQILNCIEKRNNPPIGQYVDVNGEKMNLYVQGEGENTIVLLPGLGTTSPVLDFMPLAQDLAKENRVVIVEPFGYGWSDITSEERTIENQVEDIRCALRAAEISGPYILMPHSISGLYAMYYANTYPEEVAGIIGIESTLPKMTEYFEEEYPSKMPLAVGWLSSLGVMRLLTIISPESFISDNSSNYYSEENLTMQKYISAWKGSNRNVVDEMNHIGDSISKTRDMTFGNTLPVLLFTSDDSNQDSREDGKTSVSFNETYITNPEIQKVIPLSGPHYQHWTCKDEICAYAQKYILQ